MTSDRPLDDTELQRVLWACYDCWQGQELPPGQRDVCYTWVVPTYQRRFRIAFPQHRLLTLSKLGLLRKADTARAAHRRYYKLVDPQQVAELLRNCGLL